ncbi:MAG: zinc metallopeptidase [Longimicrobiales bacterium]|nr:zinc metallopeptidase [Longimicrobiales bacterium]
MRWTRGTRSKNLDDRRFQTGGGRVVRGAGLGLGGLVILLLLSLWTGQDFFSLVGGEGGFTSMPQPGGAATPGATTASEEELVDFMSSVLDDIQEQWHALLPQVEADYQDTQLVLFRDAIQSACGFAQSATGPFYCPGDRKVYIDLSFYDELRTRFGAPGDFAQAYVLAHEIGHHIQTLLGIEGQVRQLQRSQPRRQNEYSVAMELQADCLAGVWGNTAGQRGLLEAGDIEEGLRAASAIGDDRIQRQATGRVTPDSFTHGSSEQRMFWLRRGLETGDPDACDTFSEMGG